MIGQTTPTIDILRGVDIEAGLMQVRDDVPDPAMFTAYLGECIRAYDTHPVYKGHLQRLSVVRGRQEIDYGNGDYSAAKASFLMGGVIGLRVVECGASAELLPTLHIHLPSPGQVADQAPDEIYRRHRATLLALCIQGAERTAAVDMPFDEWAAEAGITDTNVNAFRDGVHAMAQLGERAGSFRAIQHINDVIDELENL